MKKNEHTQDPPNEENFTSVEKHSVLGAALRLPEKQLLAPKTLSPRTKLGAGREGALKM